MILYLTENTLHYRTTLGKTVRVLAIATTRDEANQACAASDTLSVVAELFSPPASFILLADRNDIGAKQ